jgi:hypothetical protein
MMYLCHLLATLQRKLLLRQKLARRKGESNEKCNL